MDQVFHIKTTLKSLRIKTSIQFEHWEKSNISFSTRKGVDNKWEIFNKIRPS